MQEMPTAVAEKGIFEAAVNCSEQHSFRFHLDQLLATHLDHVEHTKMYVSKKTRPLNEIQIAPTTESPTSK